MKQRPEADKLGLSVKRNPQKIPAAHGGTTDAPFDALLPVEVGFISERVKIPADPRRVVQRHIGANIVLCGMHHPQLRVESACAYSTFGWNLSPRKKPFQITPMRCHFLSVGLSSTRRE